MNDAMLKAIAVASIVLLAACAEAPPLEVAPMPSIQDIDWQNPTVLDALCKFHGPTSCLDI